MALPSYDKSKRKKSFQPLPKGAYVVEIKGVKKEKNRSGNGEHLTIAFDIAEGEYKDFYQNLFDNNSNENKKWSYDALFYLAIPDDNSKSYVMDNWNTFFADLEDSNNGYVFAGDHKALKGKIIGGRFHIEQSEYNGKIYNHTRMRWTAVADDVRSGNFGGLPEDKLISKPQASIPTDSEGFMEITADPEDVPF